MKTRVVGLVLLAAALVLADEKAPLNPFADAAVGDWEVLSVENAGKTTFEEWSVTKVEADKVTVKVTGVEKAFSRQEAPSLGAFYPGLKLPGPVHVAKSGAATLPMSGKEWKCQKVDWSSTAGEEMESGTLYLAPTVKGAGIVRRDLMSGGSARIVGHGTKEKALWGQTLRDASEKK